MLITFIKSHKLDVCLATGLLVVALLPRILGLGIFLTADEKNWMNRSNEFVRAFHDLRFNDMLQTTHPGVPTLWVAGLAITAKSILSHVPFANSNLIYFVKTAQFSIATLNALAIPAIYLLLLMVTKKRFLSTIAVLFISLDPYIIGYSRVVHVDALMASLLTMAVVASMLYAKRLTRPWLIVSAVFAVLAILTKVPAVFVIPLLVIALAVYQAKAISNIEFLKNRLRDSLLWILFSIVAMLLLWPALLWVPNPAGNVLQLNKDISTAAITPHNSNEEFTLDVWHYPKALLDRSNPISFIGGLLGIIGLVVSFHKKKVPREHLLIALYFIGFVGMMTLGAKKGDRYIMPAFFALDILAAYGVLWVASVMPDLIGHLRRTRLDSRLRPPARRASGNDNTIFIGLLTTAYLLVTVISYHPYEIAYSNPLFKYNLSEELGWGEGLDQVADWLNQNHPKAIVASWYPEELGAFTSATVLHINAHAQNPVNYIVLYKNMFGRDPSHYASDFIDEYFKKRNPVHVVTVAGQEYAWVYEKPSYTSAIGDLNASLVTVQEIVVQYSNMRGIQILPATHLDKAKTGTLHVEIAKELQGKAIFTKDISVIEIKDAKWLQVLMPDNVNISSGDHIFVRIYAVGATTPYPSIRYSPKNIRQEFMYLSRTGSIADLKQKPGTLAVQLLYLGTDGKIATELEEKLLK